MTYWKAPSVISELKLKQLTHPCYRQSPVGNAWHLTCAALEHECKVSWWLQAQCDTHFLFLFHHACLPLAQNVSLPLASLFSLWNVFNRSKCSLHIVLWVKETQLQNQRADLSHYNQTVKNSSPVGNIRHLWSWRNCDKCKIRLKKKKMYEK